MIKGFYYLGMARINLVLWDYFGSSKAWVRGLQYTNKAGEIFNG